jgi:hypothetical protein
MEAAEFGDGIAYSSAAEEAKHGQIASDLGIAPVPGSRPVGDCLRSKSRRVSNRSSSRKIDPESVGGGGGDSCQITCAGPSWDVGSSRQVGWAWGGPHQLAWSGMVAGEDV